MKRDEFTADLSARLRSQGVDFDPAALKEFSADVRGGPSQTGDVNTLAEWFAAASGRYAVEARRRFVARHALREGLLLSVLGVVLVGIFAWLCLTGPGTSGTPPESLLFRLASISLPLCLGVAGILRVVSAYATLRRSRREMEAAFKREAPT